MKLKRNWKKTKELNVKNHPYTSSVLAFYGHWFGSKEKIAFLKISDCKDSITLHSPKDVSKKEMKRYIKKLKRLRNFIDKFIQKLEKQRR